MDETETLLLIPGPTFQYGESYRSGFGVSRTVLEISLHIVFKTFTVILASDHASPPDNFQPFIECDFGPFAATPPMCTKESRIFTSRMKTTDANDMIYYFDASRNYNPEPQLEKITAPLIAVNSADDQINPPELKILDRDIQRVKNGQYVLLPITDKTRGHGTHSWPAIWGDYLAQLLQKSQH